MNKQTQKTLGILIVIIIILVGFYIYNNSVKTAIAPSSSSNIATTTTKTITATTTKTNGIIKLKTTNTKGYKVQLLPTASTNTPKIPVPDLNRKISFDTNTSSNAKKIITEKINTLVKELKKNSNSPQSWIELGLYRKISGDYTGARDAWEYASVINPKNSVSFRDLGDLYGYYLKDNKKAEKNFLQAIKNEPTQIEYYFKTARFYKNVMNDTVKARGVIYQGIAYNPNSKELKSFLVTLK